MKRSFTFLAATAALGTMLALTAHLAFAQPSKGAAAAFERVREVMTNRFKDVRLSGDPDRDFATLLIAHQEDLIFLAKTQLEHGGDPQLRRLAEGIAEEQQKQISAVKEWQIRNRPSQPDQAGSGAGSPDWKEPQTAEAAPSAASPPAAPAQTAPAAASLPLVSGTVEKVDAAGGRVTIDHGPIPNLNMDAMSMVFRVPDPALLEGLKLGEKVQFQADRVDGRISVVAIQTSSTRAAPAQGAARPAAAPPANLPMVSGTVEKVDAAQGKITIDHGPIPNLNMDAMTMVFRAQDTAVLKGVKAGDKVRFQADRVNGQISVLRIQKGR